MDPDVQSQLRALLTECRVLTLAVAVDGSAVAGLLPYVVRPDFGGFLIHASALARHTQGLGDGARCGIVIHRPDHADADPLQLPRMTLEADVRVLPKESRDYEEGRDLYVERFPRSAMTFGLGDFHLYELVPVRGRFVTGFAGSANIGPRSLRNLAS